MIVDHKFHSRGGYVPPTPPPTPTDWSKEYLTMQILTGGTIVWVEPWGGSAGITYKLNDGQWTTAVSEEEINVSAGDELRWKGNGVVGSSGSLPFSASTAYFNVAGNIESLEYFDAFSGETEVGEYYSFAYLFAGTNVVSAENLVLPATTLQPYCYRDMFRACYSLTKAPKALKATTVPDYAYAAMFQHCHSLTTTPIISATTFGYNCCESMFEDCSALTTAPTLPATALNRSSYRYMFRDCTSLVNVPELPATELGSSCYAWMFAGCTSLVKAQTVLPATTMTGTTCYEYMYSGCTSLATAPVISATTLVDSGCTGMFQGCTSLTTPPPALPERIENCCYQWMFDGCSALTSSPKMNITLAKQYACAYMFRNCSALTTAPEIHVGGTTNTWQGMFSGCTSLNHIVRTASPNVNASQNWVAGVASAGTFECSANYNWKIGPNGIPEGWDIVYVNGLSVEPTSLSFEKSASSDTFTVKSAMDYTISADEEWVSLSAESGTTGSTTFTVSVLGNDSGETNRRNATITVSYTEDESAKTKTITISQAGTVVPIEDTYLTFDIISGGTVTWNKVGSLSKSISYSTDSGTTWIELAASGDTIDVNAGDKVMFRGNTSGTSTTATTFTNYYKFGGTATFNASGNVMSLVKESNFGDYSTIPSTGTFKGLFTGSNIISAAGLYLPKPRSQRQYMATFNACTGLTTAPQFETGATIAYAFYQTFMGCTALASINLSGFKTAAQYAFQQTFRNCTALTSAELPSPAALQNYAYSNMFSGCTSLNYVKCLQTNVSATGCTSNWLLNVAATGTFVKNANMSSWPTGASGIPDGWTVIDAS